MLNRWFKTTVDIKFYFCSFLRFGKLRYVVFNIDKTTGKKKETGFVGFVRKESAIKCLNQYNNAKVLKYNINYSPTIILF